MMTISLNQSRLGIKEKACGDLPLPPQNSKFIKDQTGNYLVYCLHGYYRQGDARVRCRNGRWEVFAGCHGERDAISFMLKVLVKMLASTCKSQGV